MICVLASNNPNKARELRALFSSKSVQLLSLAELGVRFEAVELTAGEGGTFEGNATRKAVETADFLRGRISDLSEGVAVLSDDSGLVIDALGGEPGVDSALYLGAGASFAARNADILARMRDVPDDARTARFVCVAAVCLPDGSVHCCRGELEGVIARQAMGDGGFGYDPIFTVSAFGRTLAEMTVEEKNQVSHRGRAMRGAQAVLNNLQMKGK